MRQTQFALSCAGALLLVLVPASYAADPPTDMTSSAPAEATAAPADATAVPPPAGMANPQSQVAVETPPVEGTSAAPAERMAADACADKSASGSLDCEKLKGSE